MALPFLQIGDGLLGTALLASVEVLQQLNGHAWCTVVFRNVEDARVSAEALLGQRVEVKTTDDAGVEHVHFSGFVLKTQLEYEVWGSYGAHIVAVSDSYKLDVTAHKQYYAAATLSSLASQIAGRSGIGVAVKAPGGKPLNYVQYGETDFSFLSRVVDDAGAWLRASETGMEVFSSFQPGSTVKWREEGGLTSFALRVRLRPASVSGVHYDHHAMESGQFEKVSKAPQFFNGGSALTAAAQSAAQQLPAAFEPQRARAMTLSDYSDQLQAESERAVGSTVTGQGSSQSEALRAGDTVQITGSLDAAGTYGLVRVDHRWTPEGYWNRFECTPWKAWRSAEAPAHRQWEGVVPARVVAHDDPKKMGRLRVQFFWQGDATHWARLVSSHAGPGRGFMFLPEVGDEVAVMFEDGDPERPLVVGSVWNGVQAAPRLGFFAPEADIPDNDVKRIVTKSGNRLQMIDTPGVETVVLATPHTNLLRMTEKDGDTTRALLRIETAGDIILSAPKGRVHVKSKLFSREIGTAENLDGMSCAQKMEAAIAQAPLGKGVLDALGGAKGIAASLAIMFVAAAASEFTPAGWIADAIAVVVAAATAVFAYQALKQLAQGLEELYDFYALCCKQAKTSEDLKRAGKLFADAVGKIGVSALALILAKFGRKGGSDPEKLPSNPFQNGRTPTASQVEKWSEQNGWRRSQTENGPIKYTDENGVVRSTIKQGSTRAPGSADPHVELRNEQGQRIDTQGNPVTRKSPDNHTPIIWDK